MEKDEEIVAETLNGHKEAFETLVHRYTGAIYAVCMSKIGMGRDVEDLVQESFLRAYKNLHTLREPGKFGSWLYGIASNICYDWIDRKKRESRIQQVPHEQEQENAGVVIKMIQSLPEEYREAMMLFYFERKSYEEIAEILGVSKATVNFRLTKARMMLRERVK